MLGIAKKIPLLFLGGARGIAVNLRAININY
jgi:hypothetical protein